MIVSGQARRFSAKSFAIVLGSGFTWLAAVSAHIIPFLNASSKFANPNIILVCLIFGMF